MVFLFQNFWLMTLSPSAPFSAMVPILGGFALGSVTLWLGFESILKPACAPRHGFEDRRMTNARAAAR
jgi:hypothetical protein